MNMLWYILVGSPFFLFFMNTASAGKNCSGRIQLIDGLTDYQVIQRGQDGKAGFSIKGTLEPVDDVRLQYRILRRTQIVQNHNWANIPLDSNGDWAAQIDALPVGGPYRFEFQMLDKSQKELDFVDVDNVLVGDLWLLGGQSNMDGCGQLSERETPSELVHSFSLANQWHIAEDPINYCDESVYPVYLTSYVSPAERKPIEHKPRGMWPDWMRGGHGVGLAVTFGKDVSAKTGIPIGLIPCSLGGTTMAQWSQALKEKGDESLYGAMLKRVVKAGGKVKGALWWQGESDAYLADVYEQKLRDFISFVRKDLGDPNLPFYAVQLSHNGLVGTSDSVMAGWNKVQDIQRRVLEEIHQGGITASIDMSLTSAHLTAASYKRVGARLAKRVMRDVYGHTEFQPGPCLEKIEFFDGAYGDGLRLIFNGVNRRLLAPPRVSGFSVRRNNGSAEGLTIIDAEIDPKQPNAILLHLLFKVSDYSEGLYLWYGWGANPFCNVVDEEDIALPMFGPVRIPPE